MNSNVRINVVTDVVDENVTPDQCYKQLHIDYETESDIYDYEQIALYLKGAREDCENFAGLSFGIKTLELVTDSFCGHGKEVKLPFGPVHEILSVNVNNEELDLNLFTLNEADQSLTSVNNSWPTLDNNITNTVKIRYVAGYGVASDYPNAPLLPNAAKIAILLTLAHLYSFREATSEKPLHEIPLGAQSFLRPIRERLGMA